MKKLENKINFIETKLFVLFGILYNTTNILKITEKKITDLNNYLDEIKCIFVKKDFKIKKIKTINQVIRVLTKCLDQAKIKYNYNNFNYNIFFPEHLEKNFSLDKTKIILIQILI